MPSSPTKGIDVITCEKCDSTRLVSVVAKCDDRCQVVFGRSTYNGYVPADMGIGGGDYIKLRLCLNCGQTRGPWPHPISNLEQQCQYCPGRSGPPLPKPNEATHEWEGRPICHDCWCELQND